jgi:predicted ATPase
VILKEIEPLHFGPFRPGTKLLVDPEVTVITGQNDTGKSSLLRLIRLVCRREAATEADYNCFRIGEFKEKWDRDPEIGAYITFEISKDWGPYFNPNHQG